ncbi:hypothetical protein MXB_3966 [Myxobolus squamalis]|nr:hypothetical protein MXB_3966 [Myxobolus squamalis]
MKLPIIVIQETIYWCNPDTRNCKWPSKREVGTYLEVKIKSPLIFLAQKITLTDELTGNSETSETTLCPSLRNPDCSLTVGSNNKLSSVFTTPESFKGN